MRIFTDPNYEVKHQRLFEADTYLRSMGQHMHGQSSLKVDKG
jgi:hypothetical protein